MFSLNGKTAFVTGASYGIGFAIAKGFAEAGARIVFNEIDEERKENGLRAYREAGIKETPYRIGHFSRNPDYILAFGSGSVNDVCRMVSYRLGIEYGVQGTAPSMDGYASVVAPPVVRNRKIIYDCTIARHIIIDLSVCAQAPYELLEAGVGDIFAENRSSAVCRDRSRHIYGGSSARTDAPRTVYAPAVSL